MVKVFFNTLLLAILTSAVTVCLMNVFSIDKEYVTHFTIFNSLFIWLGYFAPNFDKALQAHNERVQREVEDFHQKKQDDLDKEDAENGP